MDICGIVYLWPGSWWAVLTDTEKEILAQFAGAFVGAAVTVMGAAWLATLQSRRDRRELAKTVHDLVLPIRAWFEKLHTAGNTRRGGSGPYPSAESISFDVEIFTRDAGRLLERVRELFPAISSKDAIGLGKLLRCEVELSYYVSRPFAPSIEDLMGPAPPVLCRLDPFTSAIDDVLRHFAAQTPAAIWRRLRTPKSIPYPGN